MRAVNLLPRDDQNKTQRKQNVPVLISTALIVLVTGLLGVMYLSSKSTAQSKAFELEDAKAELALRQPDVLQVGDHRESRDQARDRVVRVGGALDRHQRRREARRRRSR